jgi:hypothetical protein
MWILGKYILWLYILETFTKVLKTTIRFDMSLCSLGKTLFTLDVFSLIFVFEIPYKISVKYFNFFTIKEE